MDAPLSVKRLLEQIKARLEPAFAAVCVVGEVSNAKTSGRHWYFTLKEEGAALSCAVWASQQRLLKSRPENGMRVVLKGSLNLYVAGGTISLAVTHCEAAGLGDLQQRLRELEASLRSEGIFDHAKRPLPRIPMRIAVIAALGGAALRDVLEVTGRRAPGINVLVFPAAAQGDRAVPENLLALQEAQDPHWGCDVILMVRGGGSLEDLWSFNDPSLVRAVAACALPIVTGVGHEIDTTLVDLAADRRAATPSQAGELATPDREQLQSELHRRTEALTSRMDWRLRGFESTLNLLTDSTGLRSVPLRLERGRTRLAALWHRLGLASERVGRSEKLDRLMSRLNQAHPQRRLDAARQRLALLTQRLIHLAVRVAREADRPRLHHARTRLTPAMSRLIELRRQRVQVAEGHLKGLDPKGPLHRGFVLARDSEGRAVTSASALPVGARLRLQWLDGERSAELED